MADLLSRLQKAYQLTLASMTHFVNNPASAVVTEQMARAMAQLLDRGLKIMACGNGGSTCQAMHFSEELTGRYRSNRRPLPALPLSDVSHVTCVANDFGFSEIYSRAIDAYAKPGDGLLLLTTSGHSTNLIRAVECAKKNKLITFGLLGKGGGELAGVCDYEIIAPGETSDDIQNAHMMIIHVLIEGIERLLFPENYMS